VVSFNWWRHLVYATRLNDYGNGDFGLGIRNSWSESWGAKNKHGFGGFGSLRGSKTVPSDTFAIRQVTPSQYE